MSIAIIRSRTPERASRARRRAVKLLIQGFAFESDRLVDRRTRKKLENTLNIEVDH